MKNYKIYRLIDTNTNKTIYIDGTCNNLHRRLFQNRQQILNNKLYKNEILHNQHKDKTMKELSFIKVAVLENCEFANRNELYNKLYEYREKYKNEINNLILV
jgi:hypothetical protein